MEKINVDEMSYKRSNCLSTTVIGWLSYQCDKAHRSCMQSVCKFDSVAQNGGNGQNNYTFINSPTLTFFWSHPNQNEPKIMTASDLCMHVIACDRLLRPKRTNNGPMDQKEGDYFC